MAFASDRLREYRKSKMDAEKDGLSSKESESKPSDRSVMLSEEEKKSLEGSYRPGMEVSCEVTGRLDADGTLDIISIRPSGTGMEPKSVAPPTSPMNPTGMPG
jgi:hypothetical protein